MLPARLLLRHACRSLLPVRLLPGLGRPLLAVRLPKGLRLLGPLLLVGLPVRSRHGRLRGQGLLAGVCGDGDHGAAAQVVLDVQAAALVHHVLLRVGQTAPHAADVVLHLLGGAGGAVLKGQVLLLDTGPLVREANGVPVVQDGYGRRLEVGVDEVLDDLSDDHERDGAALLVREAVDRGRNLLKEAANVLGLHHDHAWSRRRVVVDGNAGGRADLHGCLGG